MSFEGDKLTALLSGGGRAHSHRLSIPLGQPEGAQATLTACSPPIIKYSLKGQQQEILHLGCFIEDDSGILNITMPLIEFCESYPQRVQLAHSLQTGSGSLAADTEQRQPACH